MPFPRKPRDLAEYMKDDAASATVVARSSRNPLRRLGARLQAWAAKRLAVQYEALADEGDERKRARKAERGPWA